MILILSNKWDVTVDFVVRELQARDHPFLRINTEDLHDYKVTTEIPDFSIHVENERTEIDVAGEVGAVWYRRPGQAFEFIKSEDQPWSEGILEYIREQWRAWVQSLQAVDGVTWVNDPLANLKMESKIRQLRLASDLGFQIPETLITNVPDNVQSRYSKWDGEMVSKALSSPLITGKDLDKFVFSVSLDEPPHGNDGLEISPVIFQEAIVPKRDYRVTVVEDKVLSVKVVGENRFEVPLDWRTEKENVEFVETDLPNRVEQLCREYVRRGNLKFGAIDLIERDGEFFFLEINPNGEWGWLQKPWGIPIAENLSEVLIEHDLSEGENS